MVKVFKKVIFILAIIFAIISLLALFIPYFINLNSFKPKIQAFVAEKINAEIDYSTARLNFFGGIGIKLKDVELTNTEPPFKGTKLFSANDIDVRFEIIPLFSKKLIGTVYIDEPIVNIVTIGNKNNLESLQKPESQSKKPEDAPKDSESSFTIVLNEFSVNDANVIYKDLTNPSEPTIIDMKKIDINMVREGDVFDIEKLKMTLFSGDLDAQIKIDTADPQTAYSGHCSLKKFSLEDIYHSFGAQKKKSPLVGTANLDFNFDGKGTTEPIYSKNLNAKGNFNIDQGSLKLDTAMPIIFDQLGQFLGTITLQRSSLGISRDDIKKAASTDFQEINLSGIKGNFTVKNGYLLIKNKIPMQQGQLDLDLSIGIFNSKLKGVAIFKATEAFTKSLVASNKNFVYLLDKDNRFLLKIYLSGTVENPKIDVDTKDVMQNFLLRTTKSILNPTGIIQDTINTILPF